MCKKYNFNIESKIDGLQLSAMAYVPEHIDAILQIAHGMAEHKERYEPMMQYLANHNIMSVIMDHRGHGESVKCEEDFGYFYDHKCGAIVEDAHQLTKYIKKEIKNVPFILFGHSMGSMVVRNYIQNYDDELDGLIVCGSPSENKLASIAKKLCKVMSLFKGSHYRSKLIHNLAFSQFNKSFEQEGSENAWLSKNKENVERYDQDPRCGFLFTLNGFYNLFDLMKQTYNRNRYQMKNPNLMVLFVAGSEDPCIVNETKFNRACDFMKSLGYKEVSSKLFPTLRHEILFENESEEVLEVLNEWIKLKIL